MPAIVESGVLNEFERLAVTPSLSTGDRSSDHLPRQRNAERLRIRALLNGDCSPRDPNEATDLIVMGSFISTRVFS